MSYYYFYLLILTLFKLINVIIPENVNIIGNQAFMNCFKLSNFFILSQQINISDERKTYTIFNNNLNIYAFGINSLSNFFNSDFLSIISSFFF